MSASVRDEATGFAATLAGAAGQGSVPILMYHQVSPRPLPAFARYTVTPKVFATQMKWLGYAGYETVSLRRLAEHRAGRAELPPRPVVVTFDDGFQEVVEHAVPVLRRQGFTATFFLVAGLMGRPGRWLRREIGTEIPLMSWSDARELAAAGFECGAHTVSHPRLTTLSSAACRRELRDSRRLLEDELGCEVRHLAYPFGSYDAGVRAITAESGYLSACSTRAGLSGPADDPLALHRVSVYGHETLPTFLCRLRTARPPRQVLRETLRRLAPGAGRVRHG